MTTVLHVSDLHFGRPAVPAHIAALEALVQDRPFDVVAVSGDLSQRARAGEFQRASVFLRDAARVSRTIVVPGNHDVMWWRAPLGLGDEGALYENYRAYVDPEIEPVLRVDGATFVGLNTSQGVLPQTLTWNVRDISIIGHLRKSQIARAAAEFAKSPPGDAKVIVMHHNPVKGELSQRHGLKDTRKVLGAFAEIGVDLVLCGHDHQEAIHFVEHTKKGTVISTAGTVSSRSRGGRPSSANAITLSPEQIDITTLVWSAEAQRFLPGPRHCFDR
ncbi:metallophosphoesterase [Roseisolibacter sp. H3M3-2]|uniref:metallophosphoesterase family protein n=1 Tax=Roseisolibacter sp. H3M3-2 TaxID=3031323 RepID=UPI0023DBE416|nr:metallophosphoesterase [Roseisolibacter sp. H3M3-2]MDF1501448.1 metallophosphoesterase [Roseisolibacter sp. H3M3-2]